MYVCVGVGIYTKGLLGRHLSLSLSLFTGESSLLQIYTHIPQGGGACFVYKKLHISCVSTRRSRKKRLRRAPHARTWRSHIYTHTYHICERAREREARPADTTTPLLLLYGGARSLALSLERAREGEGEVGRERERQIGECIYTRGRIVRANSRHAALARAGRIRAPLYIIRADSSVCIYYRRRALYIYIYYITQCIAPRRHTRRHGAE